MRKMLSAIRLCIKVLLTLVLISASSCQNESSEALIQDFQRVVDATASETNFSSLFESYNIIRLETTDDCMLGGIEKIIKNNSLLYIKTANDELVLFDSKGNYIKKIGTKGRGPGEYIRIQDFAVNKDGSVVAICNLRDIHFYRVSDGSYIRKQSFDYFLNSLFYLPNGDLLAQVTQADFLIAHINIEGNIINTFGTMSMALELEQPFEFVKLDDSNVIYRVGQTTDYYHYNLQEKVITRKQIFEDKNALREQELHEKLVAIGPDPLAYRLLGDYFSNHYRILYLKKLNTDLLVYYLYKENSSLLLYNRETHTLKNFIFSPEESSNLIDDIMYLPASVLSQMHKADSDDNSIITYISANSFLKHFKSGIPNSLKQSKSYEEVLELIKSLKNEDNPLIIEYHFKEI
jgi:hypothetical protein